MSSRALKKAREAQQEANSDQLESEESSDEEEVQVKGGISFAAFYDDDDDDDDDDDGSSDDDSSNGGLHEVAEKQQCYQQPAQQQQSRNRRKKNGPIDDTGEESEEEDIDSILSSLPALSATGAGGDKKPELKTTPEQLALIKAFSVARINGVSPYDYEIEQQSVFSTSTAEKIVGKGNNNNKKKKSGGNGNDNNRRVKIYYEHNFCNPTTGHMANIRPPSFIGGGIGFRRCDDKDGEFEFIESDECRTQLKYYLFLTQTTSSDLSTLLRFIIDYPYCVQALVSVGEALGKIGRIGEGRMLVRRAVRIFEQAMGGEKSFSVSACTNRIDPTSTTSTLSATYYRSLKLLLHHSTASGCHATSSAIARYLRSISPGKDTIGLLPIYDSFLLKGIDCEDKMIGLWELGGGTSVVNKLPNLMVAAAFSYYTSSDEGNESYGVELLAKALTTYPSILARILTENKVDVVGRAMRGVDWSPVLSSPFFAEADSRPIVADDNVLDKALSFLVDVFIGRSSDLYKSDKAIRFLYEGGAMVVQNQETFAVGISADFFADCRADIIAYADEFKTEDFLPGTRPAIPAEFGEEIDETLLQHALEPRKNLGGGAQRKMLPDIKHLYRQWEEQEKSRWAGGSFLKSLAENGNEIDPEDPLLQIFLQSFLPWNNVAGI